MSFNHTERGFSLIESVLAISMLGLFATIFIGAMIYGTQSGLISGNHARAVLLAEEGLEAVRSMRDNDYTSVSGGSYGLSIVGGDWQLTPGSDVTGIFTRTITISTVSATSKNVVSTVTWQQGPQGSKDVSVSTRLTDWQRVIVPDP